MTVSCDRLALRVALILAGQRLAGRYGTGTAVTLLDGPVNGALERLAFALLSALGFRVSEAPFFAGHLRAASGEGIPVVARKAAFLLADRAAGMVVERSPLLRRTNVRWGRDTVRLCIAKQLWLPAERVMLRVLTAETLARAEPGATELFVTWPAALPRQLLPDLPTPVRVRIGAVGRPGWKAGRFSASLWGLRQWVRRVSHRTVARDALRAATPALLVPQEDDLSLDRSFRGQPHWLYGAPPGFRTIVLRLGKMWDVELSSAEMASHGLEVVGVSDVAAARADSPIVRELGRDFLRLCRRALVTPRAADSLAANEAARLLTTARELGQFAIARGVKAFLTCENYMLHADAMQVIAAPLDIRTISYQYANMPNPSLPMLTTSDRLVSFSPMFERRFSWPGFGTPAFSDAGYVYDSAFALVQPRADDRRARLRAAGAQFIIGFFDESVQHDKYGLVNADDYASELMVLLDLMARDTSVGLVFKTQFHQNLRSASTRLGAALERAGATGRLDMPVKGRHRNSVLPGEVARSSDITIGHAFGGTASLEAALAGCRSLLINSCGLETKADPLYARVDIMYPSVADACAAIESLRRGAPERQALGDWTPILPEFDRYRDGGAAGRMRAILEEAVCR